MNKSLARAIHLIGGLIASRGCVLLFAIRAVLVGTDQVPERVLGLAVLSVVLLFGVILLVTYGEKMEKKLCYRLVGFTAFNESEFTPVHMPCYAIPKEDADANR